MGKRKINFAVGEYYHVYNCGADKRVVFTNERDFGHFLLLLEHCNSIEPIKHLKEKVDWNNKKDLFIRNRVTDTEVLVTIEAYCLLENHFHLLLKQESPNGISEFMQRVQGGYSRKYNATYGTLGTRFQGRFQATHIDNESYLYQLLAYVPVNYLVHKITNTEKYVSSISNAFSGNIFISDHRLVKDNFKNLEDFLKFAIPKVNETRRLRGKDEIFE